MRGQIDFYKNLQDVYYGCFEELKVPKSLFLSTKSGQGHGERSVCYLLTGVKSKQAQKQYLQNTFDISDICVKNSFFEVKSVSFNNDVRVGISGYEFVWQVSNYLEQIYTELNNFKNNTIIKDFDELLENAWVKIKKRYFSRKFIGIDNSAEISVKNLLNLLPASNHIKRLFEDLVVYINNNICECFDKKITGVFFCDQQSTKFMYVPRHKLCDMIEFSRISTHAKIRLKFGYTKSDKLV